MYVMLFGRRFVCLLLARVYLSFFCPLPCPVSCFLVGCFCLVPCSFLPFSSCVCCLFPLALFVLLCLLYWMFMRFGHSNCMLSWFSSTHPPQLSLPFLPTSSFLSGPRSSSLLAHCDFLFLFFLLSACCAVCSCRGGVFLRGGYVVSALSMPSLSAFCFAAARCFRPCNARSPLSVSLSSCFLSGNGRCAYARLPVRHVCTPAGVATAGVGPFLFLFGLQLVWLRHLICFVVAFPCLVAVSSWPQNVASVERQSVPTERHSNAESDKGWMMWSKESKRQRR